MGEVARFSFPLALLVALSCASACSGSCSKESAAPDTDASAAMTAPPPSASHDHDWLPRNVEDTTMKCPPMFVAARRDGTVPNRYVVPTNEERAQMRAVIAALMTRGAAARAEAEEKLGPLGFVIEDVAEVPGAVGIHEIEAKKRGGGAYLIRLGDPSKLLVETPHTFYDEGTFPLGCDFFDRTHARALFMNTMHRYKGAPAGEDGLHPSDVAHSPTSLFQAATEGAVDALGKPTVIQLHGFAERESGGRAVISTGEKQKDNPLLIKMKDALEVASGKGILRYPDDAKELGATTNVQGTIVRAAGGLFFHMEMSEGFRQELIADEALRSRTWKALVTTLDVH